MNRAETALWTMALCLTACSGYVEDPESETPRLVGSDVGAAATKADPADASAGASNATADAGAADTGSGPSTSGCKDVNCGTGACKLDASGLPGCACTAGYRPSGLTCVRDQRCATMQCGRCAQCEIVNDAPTCTCPDNMKSDGRDGCVADPDPCQPNPCGSDEVCVNEVHCDIAARCFPQCDCTNCSNCSGQLPWGGVQCADSSGASVACNKPCKDPTWGCFNSYPSGFCFPDEGCLGN